MLHARRTTDLIDGSGLGRMSSLFRRGRRLAAVRHSEEAESSQELFHTSLPLLDVVQLIVSAGAAVDLDLVNADPDVDTTREYGDDVQR